jgi:ribosomal protein S14
MQAYIVYCQDNDSYAYREYPSLTKYERIHQTLVPDMSGTNRRGVRRCEACGELLAKWDEPLNGLVITKRRYDISCTYDGVTVVSECFKSTYEAASLKGLTFCRLPDDNAFFAISAGRVVPFDADRRETRFIDQCPKCGRFESVVGATPAYLKKGTRIGPREFVRTDLEFASEDEKSPLLICGEQAAKVLSKAKLKGLDLVPLSEPVSEATNE